MSFGNNPSKQEDADSHSKQAASLEEGAFMGRPEVLLAGKPANSYSDLAQLLASWGARCNFANSFEEVSKLLGERTFDFVVCEMALAGGSAFRAIPLLAGSATTLFCSYPVEDTCLWIQVVEKGRVCQRPVAWRPDEFGQVLRQVVKGKA